MPVVRLSHRHPLLRSLRSWFDTSMPPDPAADPDGIEWPRVASFVVLHAGCLGVIWVGWSPFAVATAVALYFLRMFALTGFYHRYFSHRTFRTTRGMQLLFAILGNSAVQRGPLWWAAHHRRHHRFSDQPGDPHSPRVYGVLHSHIGWITVRRNYATDFGQVPDLARYPELRFLDRFDTLVPMSLAAGLFALGAALERLAPGLGTSGPQLLVWGFFVSTTVLFHGTCLVNSAAHLIGRRRFETSDDSRNSFLLAIPTMGEGWHNNHHHFPGSTRQGFYWWEIDLTYYGLKLLSWAGIVSDIRPVDPRVLARRKERQAA